ncbi:MAG: glycosyltransferase family 39 protein [Candidatus Omnitrophica bacterium]|nr:glycosyltransferase family 39 protein [Candidatus Omnitrophota bacterium]
MGVTAWFAPPNTWDSLVYHMSRVVHWIQNRSVAHYSTVELRQLIHPPWAEFAIMHFQILSQGDHWAGFVQWFSLLGSVIAASLVAGALGAKLMGQIAASMVCLTIPSGILQASGTKNDYAVGYWLVVFVYFLLLYRDKLKVGYLLGLATGLGLAFLTKISALVFSVPFLLWLLLLEIKQCRREAWKHSILVLGIVLILNVSPWARNFSLFGYPFTQRWKESLAASDLTRAKNEVISVPFFIVLVADNIFAHLGSPVQPLNRAIASVKYHLHRFLGVTYSDARITYGAVPEYTIIDFSMEEVSAGNLYHVILATAALVLCISLSRFRQHTVLIYGTALCVAFVFFCAYHRWSPYNVRLHLPLFVMAASWIGFVLAESSPKWITHFILTTLCLMILPYTFWNPWRPIFGARSVIATDRWEQYFYTLSELGDPIRSVTSMIRSRGYKNIGLVIGKDHWEYPYWVFLNAGPRTGIRIEHLDVDNVSKTIPQADFVPEAVIFSRNDPELLGKYDGLFQESYYYGKLALYMSRK